MLKVARLAAMVAVTFAAAGCASMNAATSPTEEQIKQADFAAAPNPAGFEKAIRAWALDTLKDPDAMQIRDLDRESSKGWLTQCVEPGEFRRDPSPNLVRQYLSVNAPEVLT